MTTSPDRDPYEEGLVLSSANRHAEAIARYEEALRASPGDIRVLFALGTTASALGLPKPAEAFFRQVLAHEPDRLEALVNLANLLRAQGDFDAAEALLTPAVARNPNAPELRLALGSTRRERGEPVRAVSNYREALRLRPNYPAALGNLADCLADDRDFAEAFALYERALALDPANAQLRLNRAVLHLLNGNLAEGWNDYEARLGIKGKVPESDHGLPRWNEESLAGRSLLVTAEQGIGDQLMFASLIPEIAGRIRSESGRLFLECEKRLVPLLTRSLPDVSVHPGCLQNRSGIVAAGYEWLKAEGGADFAIEMGSLGRILRKRIAQFPRPHHYLRADENEVRTWRKMLRPADTGFLVGICWRSGKVGGGRAAQFAPLEAWANFLPALPGEIVCAQYDARPDEISELETRSGRKLIVPQDLDQKNELDRTCAMLSALDCVVSAPTAVSWISAGAGVPTYKILYDTSWTGFGRDYEPFAPACELVMPETRGNWTNAFSKAARAVNARSARV